MVPESSTMCEGLAKDVLVSQIIPVKSRPTDLRVDFHKIETSGDDRQLGKLLEGVD